ncbi:3'(2'), 5'-bisphosphate nucleotidase [Geodermatophilus bullaregiensis]|uniref:inositol monophosphatase family protein n=1 Tax=Geodermatophilus bullaregiensis TaxID=1564160 RepID=UPI0027DE9168|nr:inositol monophosphatase family protein [Geodermatophilus bullaregiensis]MBM7807315.1 3'(2'), 5'-bisphosphate nucleotidase [Geodermatophilus bullaregiensis]
MGETGTMRVAASGEDLWTAAELLGMSPAALAPELLDPGARLLVGDGAAAHLRRRWTDEGITEAVVVHRSTHVTGRTALLAVASAWGCSQVRDAGTGRVVEVAPPPAGAPLADRFGHLAALAATQVEVAVALARDSGRDRVKADGSWSLAADEAAHDAAAEVMAELGVTVLSEERADLTVPGDEPWVVLDPLDGTGNFRAGLPPWAFSAALVHHGRAVAGLVVDLSSGRRWAGAGEAGAWRDGVPARVRPGSTLVAPTAPTGRGVLVPSTARRVRVTGCTAVDVCLVADGSAGAWHNLDRGGTHVHDVAGGLAVLAAAGGVALTADGAPLRLEPDTETLIRFAAAATGDAARELISAVPA